MRVLAINFCFLFLVNCAGMFSGEQQMEEPENQAHNSRESLAPSEPSKPKRTSFAQRALNLSSRIVDSANNVGRMLRSGAQHLASNIPFVSGRNTNNQNYPTLPVAFSHVAFAEGEPLEDHLKSILPELDLRSFENEAVAFWIRNQKHLLRIFDKISPLTTAKFQMEFSENFFEDNIILSVGYPTKHGANAIQIRSLFKSNKVNINLHVNETNSPCGYGSHQKTLGHSYHLIAINKEDLLVVDHNQNTEDDEVNQLTQMVRYLDIAHVEIDNSCPKTSLDLNLLVNARKLTPESVFSVSAEASSLVLLSNKFTPKIFTPGFQWSQFVSKFCKSCDEINTPWLESGEFVILTVQEPPSIAQTNASLPKLIFEGLYHLDDSIFIEYHISSSSCLDVSQNESEETDIPEIVEVPSLIVILRKSDLNRDHRFLRVRTPAPFTPLNSPRCAAG